MVVVRISLFWGRFPRVFFFAPVQSLADLLAQCLILNPRPPRLVAAVIIGMSLAGAGLVLQMVFSNPLVEPGFLGVSQVAALGAALSIIFLSVAGHVQTSGVLVGWGGLVLSYWLARRVRYGGWILRLLLSGIAVLAFFASGVGSIKCVADPLCWLPEIPFGRLGGLTSVTRKPLLVALPLMVTGMVVMTLMRWRLILWALEDESGFLAGGSGVS
ncbi:MAG: iron ABC transporter permease [Thermanaerothrix sp.]|nr:iron ABC transporter permease [Thermanaerothrix sp.]